MLHIVKLCEFPAVVRCGILLKFLERLPPKIAAINEKKYPSGTCELD